MCELAAACLSKTSCPSSLKSASSPPSRRSESVAHSIYIFPRAMVDIRGAVIWHAERSATAGSRLHAGLLSAIRSLADNPERCPMAAEASEIGFELRELLY